MLVDRALAARLEVTQAWRRVHYAQSQARLRPDLKSRTLRIGSGYAIYAGPDSPVNRTMGLGMRKPVTESDIDAVEYFYKEVGAAPRIDLCPLANESLLELLKARKYNIEWFDMTFVVKLPVPGVAGYRPSPVRVEAVNKRNWRTWVKVVAGGFSEKPEDQTRQEEVMAPVYHSQNSICYLAYLDDEPAGGGALYMRNGVAEFGVGATLPSFRNRGVHAALLHYRLDVAANAGCRLALVVSEPGTVSQKNIEKAGFHLAYTRAGVTRAI